MQAFPDPFCAVYGLPVTVAETGQGAVIGGERKHLFAGIRCGLEGIGGAD